MIIGIYLNSFRQIGGPVQYFCLDVGGTETRGAIFSVEGENLATAKGPGGALSLGAEQAEIAIRDVWQNLCQQLDHATDTAAETQLIAGIAGKGLPGRAKDLTTRLNDFADVHIVGDGYAALLAATKGQPGAVISIGTGVTALRLTEAGNTIAISGWGFPAGDHGSGAWLGLQLVGDLTKYIDGIVLSPPLTDELASAVMQITGQHPHQIMEWQTSAKPKAYGALAPLIVEHAEAGNLFCQNMLQTAAQQIVELATALYEGNNGDVHLAGGLGEILMPYCEKQAPNFNWKLSIADPVAGLFLLASGQAPTENAIARPKQS